MLTEGGLTVSKFKRMSFFLICFATIMIVSGCINSSSPVEDIYEVLEQVVAAESSFEQQQDPLVDLEKKEQELYSEIIALGMKEFDQIVELSNEAIAAVEQRKELMNQEQESIEASKQQFEGFLPLIEKLEDEDVKKIATDLYEIMMARYEAHDLLYTHYLQGLEYDVELYTMFQKEDLSIDDLEAQITKINETYKIVLEANEKFNEKTKSYNETKLKFYEAAGLEISENNKE